MTTNSHMSLLACPATRNVYMKAGIKPKIYTLSFLQLQSLVHGTPFLTDMISLEVLWFHVPSDSGLE